MIKLEMKSIGKVYSSRIIAEDDNWNSEKAFIELSKEDFTEESLAGLSDFSHCEILFYMHQVEPSRVEKKSRHPRNNASWPKVVIFSQRGKNRPNQIGTTICRIQMC